MISTRKCYSVGRANAELNAELYIGGSTLLCQFIEPVTFVHCAYSILCPLGPGALSGSKKLKRITVLIPKEPLAGVLYILTEAEQHLVSYSILCP